MSQKEANVLELLMTNARHKGNTTPVMLLMKNVMYHTVMGFRCLTLCREKKITVQPDKTENCSLH